MKCSVCNTNVNDGSNECPNCGAKLIRKASVLSIDDAVGIKSTDVSANEIKNGDIIKENIPLVVKAAEETMSVDNSRLDKQVPSENQNEVKSLDVDPKTTDVANGTVQSDGNIENDKVIFVAPPPPPPPPPPPQGKKIILIVVASIAAVVLAIVIWFMLKSPPPPPPPPTKPPITKYVTRDSSQKLILIPEAEECVRKFTKSFFANVAVDKGINGVFACSNTQEMQDDAKKMSGIFKTNKVVGFEVKNVIINDVNLNEDVPRIVCTANFNADMSVNDKNKTIPVKGYSVVWLEIHNNYLVVVKVKKWNVNE